MCREADISSHILNKQKCDLKDSRPEIMVLVSKVYILWKSEVFNSRLKVENAKWIIILPVPSAASLRFADQVVAA